MQVAVDISPSRITTHEAAVVSLVSDGSTLSELYFDFTTLLKAVRQPTDPSLDFLLVASSVYAMDKLIPRSTARDGWQRSFDVTVPVKDATVWSANADTICQCLSFLSGDNWRMSFTERTRSIVRRKRRKRRVRRNYVRGEVASLFSGGLDSLIGAINRLEDTSGESICFVGHHDPAISGVQKDQEQLLKLLEAAFPKRFRSVLVGIGHSEKSEEMTMRSRSLLFVALGLVVADHLGGSTPLLLPENGTIAVNVPLTPSRRGSCSTRTAHPYYLALLQQWIDNIGLSHPICNPLLDKTKGEAVAQCKNQSILKTTALLSTSCAKPGHKRWWVRRDASACGGCMPCIYRRASLHKVGLDTEGYGYDICADEIDVADPNSAVADDLRACLSFLRRNHSRADVAKMLIANGPLPPLEALSHADTVCRAMDEIRTLFRDKGSSSIKRMAGLHQRGSRAN
jgi:hypothetical protein